MRFGASRCASSTIGYWLSRIETTRRPATLVGLAVVGCTAVIFIGWDELTSLSFEPTDASNYQAWAAQPVGTAGGWALACSVVGLIAWFLSRRDRRLFAVAGVGVLAGAAVLVWGPIEHASRAHPEYERARTLQSLEMPPGYARVPTRLDHPGAVDGPAATRLWTTTLPLGRVCGELAVALQSWADHESVRGPGRNTVERCYLSARKDGHPVDANVTPSNGRVAVSVRLGW